MNLKAWVIAMIGCSVLAPLGLQADEKEEIERLKSEVPVAINQFKTTDTALTNFFNRAYGYALFPRVGKGGFIVGGAGGKGLVYQKGKLIGSATLSQGTFGAQIGGQVFSEVIFFETESALTDFKQSQFTLAAQAGAVAAASGVARNAKYRNGVAIFTMVQSGLMAEASVGGQRFEFKPIPR